MKCERVDELIELLQERWHKEKDISLLHLLKKIASEVAHDGELSELTDESIIYHLKMEGKDKYEPIPGIKKDYEEDFKTALLKARGVIKE